MDFKKFFPTLIPIIALVINSFSDQIAGFLATHPTVSLLAVTIVTAIANAIQPKKT